jgi:type IV pilus assembly protein PilX
MPRQPTHRTTARQRGAALVVGLIFLAMLSLMGVAAYMVANQEERMAGNARDRIRAFEAAEASLRDCESLLGGFGALPEFNGDNGMHEARDFSDPEIYKKYNGKHIYQEYGDDGDGSPGQWLGKNGGAVRVLPKVGGAPAIPDVAEQPRCIIERIVDIEVHRLGDARSGPQEIPTETIYRVTAMGYGTNLGTTANLQTMFRRP